jgi:hypothetical protein
MKINSIYTCHYVSLCQASEGTVSLPDSASNKNKYQQYFLGSKGGRCLGLITLPPSCADCLEIWEHQPPGTLRVFPGL